LTEEREEKITEEAKAKPRVRLGHLKSRGHLIGKEKKKKLPTVAEKKVGKPTVEKKEPLKVSPGTAKKAGNRWQSKRASHGKDVVERGGLGKFQLVRFQLKPGEEVRIHCAGDYLNCRVVEG